MAARNDQEELKKKVENLESELKYLQEQLRKKETQISKLRAENKLVLNEKSELQKEMKIKEALHLSLEKENTFLKVCVGFRFQFNINIKNHHKLLFNVKSFYRC